MASKRKLTINRALAKAVDLFGSEKALAEAVGIAQQNMNRAIKRGRVSPTVAIGIHHATNGLVTADELRPDLWTRPDHVPKAGSSA
jgi:DNA-binding transcriptional regulator YdaS (Cro superfamily)